MNNEKRKGKKYIKGKLEYEGEYLFSKKYNGKGYDKNGNIIYELNNGNGKVIEYYFNNIIEYIGEYKNGKKHGKGKEYDIEGNIKFDGEYKDGIRWNGILYKNKIGYELKNGKGYVKQYMNNMLVYEGEYFNGKKDGKGKEYYDDKLIFEGEFLNGLKNGKGKEYSFDKLIYEGEFSDNIIFEK